MRTEVCAWLGENTGMQCGECDKRFHWCGDLERLECVAERARPVEEQRGAVQCSICQKWFRNRTGVCLCVCVSLSLTFCVHVSQPLSLYVSLYFSLSLYIYVSACMSASVYQPFSLSVSVSVSHALSLSKPPTPPSYSPVFRCVCI